ncbi:pantoate--beta-alanine ligase [Phenylobacterium montanum]|uniref:Pantothenate synthetase n=1 Tax=Phenylobacterium montanum TaxID=2823693 RepID=A0A975G0D1_9CAUL|nr:pantoate--beta-alanine ligase [Caulobacter sp. S6]QUD87641.1 pantoate--beta-alanine ligase [Caulobacter sp. S6]
MKTLKTIAEFRAARAAFPQMGVVPTMGFLHEGHLSLVRRAKAECGAAAVTIFVNPTQFAPHEDFGRYPRALARDLELVEAAGADLVFAPDVSEVYPEGYDVKVEIGGVTDRLEGEVRPVHFVGVATVVAKLFNITQPTRAYFGQKDAQQCVVIEKLVRDLNFPCQIVVCPTVREADGLAMSSRNAYLDETQRQNAPVLYRALKAAEARYAAGARNAEALRAAMHTVLAEVPNAGVDYVSVADPVTLEELDQVANGALISLAVRFGATRLIDNIRL